MNSATRPVWHRSGVLRLAILATALLAGCVASATQPETNASSPADATTLATPSATAAARPGLVSSPALPTASAPSAAPASATPPPAAPHGITGEPIIPKAPAGTVVPEHPSVPVAKPVPEAYVQWMTTMAQFAAADQANPPPPNGVLFVGSSTVRLWSTLKADFPQLETVINRGFGGSTMADNAYFVDRLVYPYRPRMVLIYAGDNDLAMGREPQRVLADFTAFFEAVRRELPATRITYISIKPSPSRANLSAKIALTNALVQRYLETQDNTDYIDIYHAMLDAQGQPRPELFLKDQLHMNRAGYDIWKTVISQHLPQHQGPLPPPAPPSTRMGQSASTSPDGNATTATTLAPTPAR